MALSISDIREILFGSGTGSDENEDADASADDAFVPSEMDLSVRVGHGGQEDDLAREIANIQKRAEEIEGRE
jgi:hypothetical protein